MTTFSFTRGETVQIPLENMDSAEVSAISARVRRVSNGQPTGEPVLTLAAEGRVSLGENLAGGWILSGDSSGLAPGAYAVDATLVIGSGTIITDPAQLKITP